MIRYIFLGGLLLLASCGGPAKTPSPAERRAEQSRLIRAWLAEHVYEADSLDSGLYYLIGDSGTGERPPLDQPLRLHVRTFNLEGDTLLSTFGRSPIVTLLPDQIEAWQQGLALIRPGGRIKLLAPSSLAYGAQSIDPRVRAHTVLGFDLAWVREEGEKSTPGK